MPAVARKKDFGEEGRAFKEPPQKGSKKCQGQDGTLQGRVMITWHLKMSGWKTTFLLGWLPGRC